MDSSDPAVSKTLRLGWILLAVWLPLGLTLEALHGFKVAVYLASQLRRELWTLAHAHGSMLGILCLLFASLAPRTLHGQALTGAGRALRTAAILMPVGFFLGGVLNSEGDASPGILLVPVGALFLLFALVRAALGSRSA